MDPGGTPLTVKGYITAMRWAMEDDSAKIATTLSAEDPETEGRRPLGPTSPGAWCSPPSRSTTPPACAGCVSR
jgi:hypothetical protein